MAISRAQLVKELEPGLNALFGLEYKQYGEQWTEIFDTESSDRAFEEEVMLAGFANAAVKAEGQGVQFDQAQETFTARYTNETIALAFAITEEAIEDNLYDRLASRYTKALARSMASTKNIKGAAVLNNAFDANFAGGDGKELCATDHPNKSGGTWRNELSAAADLSEAALEQMYIDIGDFRDDRNKRIAVMPTKAIIPTALEFDMERILKSVLRSDSANNDLNAIKSLGKIPGGAVVNHYLTDADAFFLKTNCPDGMLSYERESDTFDMDNDFETRNARYAAFMRFNAGWADPRGIFGSPGA